MNINFSGILRASKALFGLLSKYVAFILTINASYGVIVSNEHH